MAAPDPAARVETPGKAAEVRRLDVVYRSGAGPAVALRGVDVAFDRHVLSVVAGPSGSGKSSLLGVLAGLLSPTAGTVVVDGVETSALRGGARRRHRRGAIAVVLQRPSDNLVGYLTAIEQVELGARFRGTDPGEAAAMLEAVDVADKARLALSELSGGEQQRVAFAAAAIGSPSLLLADEPTAQLDERSGAVLIEAMRALVAGGTSLVVSSHDGAVISAADDVVRLANGRVVER